MLAPCLGARFALDADGSRLFWHVYSEGVLPVRVRNPGADARPTSVLPAVALTNPCLFIAPALVIRRLRLPTCVLRFGYAPSIAAQDQSFLVIPPIKVI